MANSDLNLKIYSALLLAIVLAPELIPRLLVDSKLPSIIPLQLVRPSTKQHQAVQGRAEGVVAVAQLLEGARDKLFRLGADARGANGQAVGPVDALLALLLDLEHLLGALGDGHEARGLVDEAAAGHVLEALLFHLDVEQDERVQADVAVLLDAVVEAGGPPAVGEEDHADRLAKVVQLQARRADPRHDGGVGHRPHGYAELARAQDQVRVRRGAERVAHDAKGNVDVGGVAQNLVAVGLDHFAVGNDYGSAIVGFLL